MKNKEALIHSQDCKCLSWRPIVAGSLVAIGLTFLLYLFSVAIGLTAYTIDSTGIQKLAFGGLMGAALGVISSMFAAGWLSGYLSQRNCSKRHLGALYGFLTWCLTMILLALLASHMHQYVMFYNNLLSGNYNMMQMSNSLASNAATTVANMHVNSIVLSAYIAFALFFLSAFACSLGGHCGMRYVCNNDAAC